MVGPSSAQELLDNTRSCNFVAVAVAVAVDLKSTTPFREIPNTSMIEKGHTLVQKRLSCIGVPSKPRIVILLVFPFILPEKTKSRFWRYISDGRETEWINRLPR